MGAIGASNANIRMQLLCKAAFMQCIMQHNYAMDCNYVMHCKMRIASHPFGVQGRSLAQYSTRPPSALEFFVILSTGAGPSQSFASS